MPSIGEVVILEHPTHSTERVRVKNKYNRIIGYLPIKISQVLWNKQSLENIRHYAEVHQINEVHPSKYSIYEGNDCDYELEILLKQDLSSFSKNIKIMNMTRRTVQNVDDSLKDFNLIRDKYIIIFEMKILGEQNQDFEDIIFEKKGNYIRYSSQTNYRNKVGWDHYENVRYQTSHFQNIFHFDGVYRENGFVIDKVYDSHKMFLVAVTNLSKCDLIRRNCWNTLHKKSLLYRLKNRLM
ncbi:hypothetical protein [Paenibacillus sp. GCM10027629]|uniref:hypothetical protein n=1 Tax=Paenibacillus sp. GCM10027629 TaxID=3273414 RepID=UPI0036D2703E